MPDTPVLPARRLLDITTLAALERKTWTGRLTALRSSGVPLNADGETDEEKAVREQREAAEATEKRDAEAAAKRAADGGDKLGEGGKAAIAAERELRKKAEKEARDTRARLDALEAEKLSDTEKLEKRATDAEAKIEAATQRLRRANLIEALAAANVAHPKAAARLLDGVEYDDATDEPKNLNDALAAAKTEFGDEMFGPARRPGANVNPGGPVDNGDGPKLTADEQARATADGMTPDEWAHYRDNPSAGPYKPAPVT